MPTATDLETRLTIALESGDFETAQTLVPEYGKTLRSELLSAPLADRAALAQKALEKLKEHLQLARVVRSHICAHLNAVTHEAQYHPARKQHYTWQVEG